VLVVIAIILTLLGLLIVGLNRASRAAQEANTRSLLKSLMQGVVQFRNEVGYVPHVLDVNRLPVAPPNLASASYMTDIQNWFSMTTAAEFLIGYDKDQFDGYGTVAADGFRNATDATLAEVPLLGIRHPGPDGLWGGTVDTNANGLDLFDRLPRGPEAGGEARRYGPYIDVANDKLLASTDGTLDPTGRLRVFFPGENGYDPTDPKVICDYWGNPIEFIRRPFPGVALNTGYRAGLDNNNDGLINELDVPTLSDVIRLRGWNIDDANAVNGRPDASTAVTGGDPTTSRALQSAEFAFLSAGADRLYEPLIRRDVDERNLDNLVEVGP